MIIKKKYLNYFIISLFLFTCTIFFWQLLDLTSRYTPYYDTHVSNLEKYYLKYQQINYDEIFNLFLNEKNYFEFKTDIGYDLLTLQLKLLGLTYSNFLFINIFLTYLVYIIIFLRISSTKYWIIYLILILLASFWMNTTAGAILRQGIAMNILFYFYINNKKISLKKGLLVTFFSSLFHLSAIFFLPYLIFEKILINRLKVLIIFFIFVTAFYILQFTYLFSDLFIYLASIFKIDTRSLLHNRLDHPTIGFSILKLLATIIPFILFILCINKNFIQTIEKKIILFFIYFSSVGMILSQLTYNERISIYAWALSPIMLAYCCDKILRIFIITFNKRFKKKIKNI
jgi:hypothetical protein